MAKSKKGYNDVIYDLPKGCHRVWFEKRTERGIDIVIAYVCVGRKQYLLNMILAPDTLDKDLVRW